MIYLDFFKFIKGKKGNIVFSKSLLARGMHFKVKRSENFKMLVERCVRNVLTLKRKQYLEPET